METTEELSYSKANLNKRWGVYLIDLFCIFFFTFILFALENMIVKNVPSYLNLTSEKSKLKVESKLYLEDEKDIVTYANANLKTYEEKKDFLSVRIDYFYKDTNFFTDSKSLEEYNLRKLEAKNQGNNLFLKEDDKIVENNLNPELLYNFYVTEINEHCLPLLFNSEVYTYSTKVLFLIQVSEFSIGLVISFVCFKVIIPLTCFKKGRQSLGMKVFKISYVQLDGFNIKTSKYLFKSLFDLIVMYFVSFVSFLLPVFVSIGMMYFTKTNQNLSEYVFNVYLVDSKDDEIYFDYLDYQDKKESSKKASIENKDLRLE